MSGPIDFRPIRRRAEEAFLLGPGSYHGPEHWRRVEAFAVRLASRTGADEEVVRLFAILHDAQRWDEGHDPEHGRRGAGFARILRGELFDLDAGRFSLLEYAIGFHADGKVSSEPTIGTCWDADRLDLPRVGMWPRESLLCTEAARELLAEMEAARKSTSRRWQL